MKLAKFILPHFSASRNPNTPNPNLSATAPAVFRRPRCKQKPSLSPPLQPEVVPTSIAASEVAFVAFHSVSRLTSSDSQEHCHAVSSSVLPSPSSSSPPFPAQMGELKKLVEEGKVKYIGLEWSLWARDVEDEIVPLCNLLLVVVLLKEELGIGIVAYSPLGGGYFGGKGVVKTLPSISSLNNHPRYQAENMEKNKSIYERIERKHCQEASVHYSSVGVSMGTPTRQ